MKIAIIIQRYGPEILGGAEQLASVVAAVLKEKCEVTVLTTTAKDHLSWKPHYKPGESKVDNIRIVRFSVDYIRDDYFHRLHTVYLNGIPLNEFLNLSETDKAAWLKFAKRTPIAFQEEMIKAQGPYSSSLLGYLAKHQDEYDRILFFTYLYATTYFGLGILNATDHAYIYPTLHDEPLVYLDIWQRYKDCMLLFSTKEEYELAESVLGEVKGSIVNYGLVDRGGDTHREASTTGEPYIIYAGRIEHAKGIDHLLKYFIRFRQASGLPLRLKLIGKCSMEVPYTVKDGVDLLGFVSEEEKLKLFQNALCAVIPSPNESLSIVLLEAFMMSSPVLVNGLCKVLLGHVQQSGGGCAYKEYSEFADFLDNLIKQSGLRETLGDKGRAYYLSHYEWSRYKVGLMEALDIKL